VDADLVHRLVAAQFPQWAGLPVTPVVPGGHDHRTFRLGAELSVRLPSAEGYAQQVAKEQRWLPVLAPRLELAIPQPVAHGAPGEGYPYEWSVYRWLEGEPATAETIADPVALAVELAGFLRALGAADAAGGPPPGPHNFHRGGPVAFYEPETLRAIEALGDRIPRDAVLAVWEAAVASAWAGEPVWFHGDVAEGNLLLRDGRLAAVIDFGTSGVGDPACDTVIAWTLLRGRARAAFREALGGDEGLWARGRGWALWKALITFDLPASRATLAEVLVDAHGNGAG
jgi:aminoglycoside phosphotransferase (APT) family kinase protein